MGVLTQPNVMYPLVASYNPRGNSGEGTVNAGLDQRKINSFYEVVQNGVTKMQTVYLSKRPPAGLASGGTYGHATQTTYLLSLAPGKYDDSNHVGIVWAYSVSSGKCQVSDNAASTATVLTSTDYFPGYTDKTAISGMDTVVLQLNHTSQQQRVFYSSSLSLFSEISSATFTTLSIKGKMEFLDGFAFAGDGSTQRIYNSELNTLDVWQPLNFLAKQIQQDGIVTLARLGKKIVCFGANTSEVFVNAGTAVGSPLVSIPELAARVGASVPHSATVDNKLYFIGHTNGASGGLWVFDGGSFTQVSRGPFNKVLYFLRDSESIYGLRSIVWGGKKSVAIQATHVSTNPQRWYMYFPEDGDWFEWNSTVFAPPNSGKWFVSVSSQAKNAIYRLRDTDNDAQQTDDNAPYQWLHQFQMPKDGNTFHRMDMCQLVGDTVSTSSGGVDHNINVSFSDDDGTTFTSTRTIDMTSAEKMVTRCGSYATRLVRLDYSGGSKVRLEKFAARVTK